jgi:hypothetical protein
MSMNAPAWKMDGVVGPEPLPDVHDSGGAGPGSAVDGRRARAVRGKKAASSATVPPATEDAVPDPRNTRDVGKTYVQHTPCDSRTH